MSYVCASKVKVLVDLKRLRGLYRQFAKAGSQWGDICGLPPLL